MQVFNHPYPNIKTKQKQIPILDIISINLYFINSKLSESAQGTFAPGLLTFYILVSIRGLGC